MPGVIWLLVHCCTSTSTRWHVASPHQPWSIVTKKLLWLPSYFPSLNAQQRKTFGHPGRPNKNGKRTIAEIWTWYRTEVYMVCMVVLALVLVTSSNQSARQHNKQAHLQWAVLLLLLLLVKQSKVTVMLVPVCLVSGGTHLPAPPPCKLRAYGLPLPIFLISEHFRKLYMAYTNNSLSLYSLDAFIRNQYILTVEIQ